MYLQELYERERHKDFVRDAIRDQTVRAAGERGPRKRFYKPALSAVGAKLVQVGNRLETVATPPMITASKRV